MSWKTKRLDEVADFCLGKMLDQRKNKGDLLPYLANINVRWGELDLDNLREMRFEQRELDRFSLKYGDLVMCEGGEPGSMCNLERTNPRHDDSEGTSSYSPTQMPRLQILVLHLSQQRQNRTICAAVYRGRD